MRIDDIFSAASQVELEEKKRRQQDEDSEILSPVSWKADRVSISDRAREMQQAAASSDAQQTNDKNETAAQKAGDKLSEAVDKATGKASSSSSADQVENLEKKIEELQTRITQVAGSSSMPEEVKESTMSSLNAQISQLTAQLAALKADMQKPA